MLLSVGWLLGLDLWQLILDLLQRVYFVFQTDNFLNLQFDLTAVTKL